MTGARGPRMRDRLVYGACVGVAILVAFALHELDVDDVLGPVWSVAVGVILGIVGCIAGEVLTDE